MGINHIDTYFEDIQNKGNNLFVPYIVAGDGGLDKLPERIAFLEQCGVAAIELGIPFSDPVADGPTIQHAGARALKNDATLANILKVLKQSKTERNVPIVLMTYINPIFAYGVDSFAKDAEAAGVDGIIIPDIPLEEEDLVAPALKKHDIAFIRLAALTSTDERLREIAKRSDGFLYAVSVTGTTGERAKHDDRVAQYLQTLKEYSDVPVLAGFGVSNPTQAHNLSAHCDGVIVGSKIVQLLHEGKKEEVATLIKDSLERNEQLV